MHIRRTVFATWLVLLFCISAVSQLPATAADPEKEKKQKEQDERVLQLLDQTIVDAAALKLPENRAVIYTLAGDLYWKMDPKRSRELFRNSAGEINTAIIDADREKRESTDPNVDYSNSYDIRNQIFPLMATRDASLALELLVQTRPASLAEAMQRSVQGVLPQDSLFMGSYNPENQRVQGEINLERQLTLLAARDDVDKAVKAIKEMLAKGISNNALPLLQSIQRKDEKLAADLAGDVVKKIVDTDLLKNDNDFRTAVIIFQNVSAAQRPPASTPAGALAVQTATMPKPFGFADAQLHDLAVKLADTLAAPTRNVNVYTSLVNLLPVFEKLLPDRSAGLRQRAAENQRSATPEMRTALQRQMLYDQKVTPEDTLAQIAKMPNAADRTYAWQNMQNKILQVDDEARAKKLIDQIGDEKIRNNVREQFEASRINKAISASNVEEARRQIANLTQKKLQIQKYVALAMQLQRKNTDKDSETAHGFMKDARMLLNEPAEDEDSVTDLMEVVRGYTVVEADDAFRLFEPVIDQMNDVINASSVLARYNKRNRDFRKGELVMRMYANGGDTNLLYKYIPFMQGLGATDFDRMSLLTDKFNRADTREIARMFILQGVIKQDRRPTTTTAPPVQRP